MFPVYHRHWICFCRLIGLIHSANILLYLSRKTFKEWDSSCCKVSCTCISIFPADEILMGEYINTLYFICKCSFVALDFYVDRSYQFLSILSFHVQSFLNEFNNCDITLNMLLCWWLNLSICCSFITLVLCLFRAPSEALD